MHNKSNKYIFWGIVISIKLLLVLNNYSIQFINDSYTYYYPFSIFDGNIHPFRMVIYPELLSLLSKFSVDKSVYLVVILQHILSFISLYIFYKILKNITNYWPIIICSVFFYASWGSIYKYDNLILAESISVLFINVFVYLLIKNIKSEQNKYLPWLIFMALMCVLLKPVFIYLLLISSIYAIYSVFKVKQSRVFSIGVLISSWMIILIFCFLNKYKNQHFGLSTISINNSLANVIQSGSYKNSNDKQIVNYIDNNYVPDSGIYDIVFKLNTNIDCQKYANSYPSIMLPINVVSSTQGGYDIPRLNNFVNSCFYTKDQLKYFTNRFLRFVSSYKKISFITLFLLILIFIHYKIKNKIPVFVVFLLGLVWSNAMIIIVMGIEDWERLFLPSFPIIAVLYVYVANLIIDFINPQKLENKIKEAILYLSNNIN